MLTRFIVCEHFTIYANIESLCCTSETNVILYINYISGLFCFFFFRKLSFQVKANERQDLQLLTAIHIVNQNKWLLRNTGEILLDFLVFTISVCSQRELICTWESL